MTALLASVEAPAAGAPEAQIAIATVFASLATALLLWLVLAHVRARPPRTTLLQRAGDATGKFLGMEPWAALPFAVGTIGLVSGGFGVFWDISLHIDNGRDEGPLANPSHYFILYALYSLFAAGLLSLGLHQTAKHPSVRAVRLPGGMTAPIGGLLMLVCGAFALTGFPLDDLWHRMFGQDVTLWGPTHLVMINGAILSVPVLAVLVLEAKRAVGQKPSDPARSLGEQIVRITLPGALLFAIAFWATEFDWGIQQYRLVWQPLLLSLAAALALTCGRLWLGRGGALRVVAFYLVARGAMELAVIALGQTAPAMPLFIVEALVIEVLAWNRRLERDPVKFGAIAGPLTGLASFAWMYAYSQVAMPNPYTTAIIAEGLPTAILAGLAGGLLGGLFGSGMRGDLPRRDVRRPAALAAAGVLVVLGANALWTVTPKDVRADVTLTPVAGPAGERQAIVTARIPGDVAKNPEWRAVTSWQGGGTQTRRMEEIAPGVYRSNGPVPLHGTWKSAIRMNSGRAMLSLPLYLPREPSIPTPGVTRPERFSAAFLTDHEVMQTERRDYVPGWLWTPAALLMLAFCGAFIAALAVGIARASHDDDAGGDPGDGPTAAPEPEPTRRQRTPVPIAG